MQAYLAADNGEYQSQWDTCLAKIEEWWRYSRLSLLDSGPRYKTSVGWCIGSKQAIRAVHKAWLVVLAMCTCQRSQPLYMWVAGHWDPWPELKRGSVTTTELLDFCTVASSSNLEWRARMVHVLPHVRCSEMSSRSSLIYRLHSIDIYLCVVKCLTKYSIIISSPKLFVAVLVLISYSSARSCIAHIVPTLGYIRHLDHASVRGLL